jgi:hypothetical protein
MTHASLALCSAELYPHRYTVSPGPPTNNMANATRRLYRILAHAYYHHRKEFDAREERTHLTRRFIAFALQYELMTHAQLTPAIHL